MDELSQLLSGGTGGTGSTGSAGGGLGELLNGLSGAATPGTAGTSGLGGLAGLGQLGALLGGATGTAAIPGAAVGSGGGLLGALGTLPALLPALLAMLGGLGANGQSGLHQLMGNLEAQGLGHVGQSWVGSGPNLAVTAQQVEQALGSAQVGQLAAQSGLPPAQVTQGVAAVLPSIVHSLTPNGQLPAPAQISQLLGGLTGQQP